MVATEEEGGTQMIVEINRIKGRTLCHYNRTVIETIRMIVHLSISSWPGKMVQLALYNATNVTNGDIFQIVDLRFILVVSVAEAEDVAEVHILAENLAR